MYQLSAADTKEIKGLMTKNGLTVTMCKLGSNKFYAQLHTSDNKKAVQVLSGTKFDIDYFDKKMPEEIRNRYEIKIQKIAIQ